ncbi:DUF4331 domain-containing protein [Leisingera aquaemixtae]|uniref:DUF4331 family protein n=1 Tax=Leisingera aquaemixtae TaxID=1396826 RepID=UPI001C97D7F8|nr:DUF4331 family protein [Leisingera aquaemixtae]MBY6066569.1 DUF4331 domain-containing protein [Leisingera aquaemixtae]
MKTKSEKAALSFAAAAVAAVSLSSALQASGHFISGLQDQYPAYDLNDTYVFQSSNDGFTSFISSANPSLPGTNTSPAGVIFGNEGLYNLHIAQDGDFQSGMTLVFSFEGENVEVSRAGAPNAAVGEAGEPLGSGKVGDTLELPDGIRVWTGRGEEPFFGNGVGLAKFNAAKQAGNFAPEIFQEDGDLFIGATASFIVVDVPNTLLGDEVKVFTTTAVPYKDEWSQVDRHANVLFPYVFLADTPAVQEDHGQHRPDLDVEERRQAIVNNVFWAVSASQAVEGNPVEYAGKVADMIMPDVLTYNPGTKASYAVDGLNGRALQDDAMNTVLHLMTGVAIDDNADDAKRYTDQFPYIVPVN